MDMAVDVIHSFSRKGTLKNSFAFTSTFCYFLSPRLIKTNKMNINRHTNFLCYKLNATFAKFFQIHLILLDFDDDDDSRTIRY